MSRTTAISALLSVSLLLAPTVLAGELHKAARTGDIGAVRALLERDPQSVNAPSDAGFTPLHLAASAGHDAIVEFLLQHGASVNHREAGHQRTPLHLAASKGRTGAVRLLLDAGADIAAREKDNETPLHYAAAADGGLETVKLLVERGSNVKDRESRAGGTPLSYAVARGQVDTARYLIERGEDPLYRPNKAVTLLHDAVFADKPAMIELLTASGIPVDAKTEDGVTPLLLACTSGKAATAKALLDKGASVDVQWNDRSPLLLAIDQGSLEIVRMLLARGARVDDRVKESAVTPLHLAATRGYGEMVSALLEKGADPNAVDARGSTPLDDARRYGHKKSVEALLAKAAKGEKPGGTAGPANTASLLARDLKDGEAVVWYLGHSGWAVKTRTRLLIFDYWDRPNPPDNPALANGRIDPAEVKNLKVIAFSTHSHDDHYSPVILDWKQTVPDMTVVTGFEPRGKEGFVYVAPRQQRTIDGMEITTINSNDSGVGFFVRTDGLGIFHAGDHANRKKDFSDPFKEEVDFLAGTGLKADVLFTPITGCSVAMPPEAVRAGAFYTIEKLAPKAVFPMHGAGNEERYVEFAKAAKDAGVKAAVGCAENGGDPFLYSNGGLKRLNGPKEKPHTADARRGGVPARS